MTRKVFGLSSGHNAGRPASGESSSVIESGFVASMLSDRLVRMPVIFQGIPMEFIARLKVNVAE